MKLGFVFREAFKGLFRNITMSVALIITTAISLALLATGVLVTTMTADTQRIYLDRIEIMVQFDDEISASDTTCSSEACQAVRSTLEDQDGVASVTFRSREQSYERFVQIFGETDPLLVQETSPDALPAALHVRLDDPLDTEPIDAIRSMDHVDVVIDQGEDLRGATDNLNAIRNATFVLAAIQAVAAVFLIANMVQIAAFNRRHEMSIMRMVGASRWYTQAPFVLEAVIATLIGAVVATVGLFATKVWVVDRLMKGLYESQLVAPITSSEVWIAAPAVAVVGVVLAAITAAVTLRLYVRT